MYPSVRQRFIAFNQQFEGRMPVMYLDTHKPPLVTTGVGNLIDPVAEALQLPFEWKHVIPRRLATPQEIEEEWNHVKSLTNLSQSPASIWGTVTRLFLNDAAMDNLIYQRLDANEAILKKRWAAQSNYATWPADAQLGLHSMAWAMGPGFNFPQFAQCCANGDFAGAAAQCHMADTNNPGLVPRNRANYRLFMNAAQVMTRAGTLSPAMLYYPQIL